MPEYVWRATDGVDDVAIWRTTGPDGPDGGGVVTVNVDRIVLMAAFLDAGDLVTGELDPREQERMLVPTVDALAQALSAVAEAVNRTLERFHAAVESWREPSQLLSCCPACRWSNPTGAASCGGCGITLTRDAGSADSAGTPCPECGAHIPYRHSGEVNQSHARTCSLHPNNVG